jgi:haloalkane dehalogenase
VLDQVLGQLNYNILSTLKLNGFERNEIITETWLKAYQAPFPTPKDALGAIGWAKGFAKNLHHFEIPDEETQAILAKKHALAVWGESDRTLNHQHFLPLFKQAFPNGQVHVLHDVGHYSPEDAPEKVARLVMEFIHTS